MTFREQLDESEEADRVDVLLLPFVRADGDAAETYLAGLLAEQTESTIKGIIRSRLRVSLSTTDGSHNNQEALELIAGVQADLVVGLRRLKDERRPNTIGNLHAYVSAVTFNACNQWLRRKYPERLRLKNKLRYLLTHDSRFALWETAHHEWLCGFAPWRGGQLDPHATARVRSSRDRLAPAGAGEGQRREGWIALLTSIFRTASAPAPLEEVVTLVAELLGIGDAQPQSDRAIGVDAGPSTWAASEPAVIQTELEQRAELQKLWTVVCELPLRHRVALLLNLRDKGGADALALLPSTGIATVSEIAHLVGIRPDEFARAWNDLPWDDLTIAKHLGLSRQQVINLRQSARARLARVWKGF